MNVRDPYDVLGVSRTASDDEIHAAYRTLAKRYRPDLHPNDPTAEARFKEIAGAYELLSDREERARYDRDHPATESDRYAGYSAERGYDSAQRDAPVRSPRRVREWAPINLFLVAFGLWALLSYGNGLLRGYSAALDGTIERSASMATPLVDYLFFRGDLRFRRSTNVYTIRAADGGTETFIAGPPCSLLYERPRTGAHVHKEAWAWWYELDGRAVSDFAMPRATSCAIDVPVRLLFVLGPLLLGLFWRSER
jgi:hypothetical protein